MDRKDLKKLHRGIRTGQAAGRASDPAFYNALTTLPNPDPILRAMGRAEDAYEAIMSDAHVIGELRAVRSGLLSYRVRVKPAKDAPKNAKQTQALELCQQVMERRPAEGMTWPDTLWNMATAVLRGICVHELDWQVIDGYLLPDQILDRPNRRFKFSNENKLRLLTKAQPVEGEETEDYKYLITRHMPSIDNPYGQALLSSCFWPYTFKHGGFKFFYQFTERFGLPWPVGRYPKGTPLNEQVELLDALLNMLESGAAAIPEGDAVELMTVKVSGELAQERLIDTCNREMSKALTSQTLATEMKNVGSNAASKTHRDREQGVHKSDRSIVEATLNEMFAYITRFNCGDDVEPPVAELYKGKEPTEERAKMWETASRIGNPSKKAFHEEMNIPMAEDENDQLVASPAAKPAEFSSRQMGYQFAQGEETLQSQAIASADTAIERDLLEPALSMLQEYEDQGKTLQQFLDDLPQLYSKMDSSELTDLTSLVMQTAMAEGIASA